MKVNEVEKFFYRYPKRDVHLRELSRKLDRSPTYVSDRLEELISGNIVGEKRKGNMKVFQALDTETEYRNRKKAFNIWQILESGIAGEIDENLYPEALVLFGSYLKGSDTEDSDIDIAVIGGRDKGIDLSDFEAEFERDIQLTRLKDIEDAEKEFKNTLSNGYLISGYLKIFN